MCVVVSVALCITVCVACKKVYVTVRVPACVAVCVAGRYSVCYMWECVFGATPASLHVHLHKFVACSFLSTVTGSFLHPASCN